MAALKILVFEYISGGGMLAEPLPPTLAREGDLMLRALLRDLADIPAVRIVALRDVRMDIPADIGASVEWVSLTPDDDAEARFRQAVEEADAVWPIAPETGGILERLCLAVESAGKALLTSPASAVRLTASKLATARRLEAHGIDVVPTQALNPTATPTFPVVAKPDDGAGCEGARIVGTREDWRDFLRQTPAPGTVIQPLLEGEAMSLSVLFARGEARLLGCNRQRIAREGGGFVLKACDVNVIRDESGGFRDLAERVALAIPELWGYAGVDLVRTAGGVYVLEVNPRLTTSYTGLRLSMGLNPAELVVETWRLGRLPSVPAHAQSAVEISLDQPHVH